MGRKQIGYITPAFSGAPKWGGIKLPTSALPFRGGPKWGEIQLATTLAFSGAPKWGRIK